VGEGAVGRASFRDVFGVPEFRALWLAQMLSVAGDQLARVALTVLVYDRTRSAALAALTFVMGVMPIFFGGAILSGLGDRLPRRTVMIGCDLARAALVLVMTVPRVPLWVLVVLLFVVTAGNAPFNAARAAIYPEILAGDRYVVGTALTITTFQFAQVIGFAAGGAIVGFFGVRTSLVADAATFAASALLVRFGVAARPAANRRPAEGRPDGTRAAPATGWLPGLLLVFGNPDLRTPMLFGWLAALYNAPEGVAAPYARSLGGGAVTTGVLLATPALGYTFGALAFGRMVEPARRARLMGPLATGCSVFLIPIVLRPPLPVTLVLFALSGACACFQVAANSAFVAAAPDAQRSQAFGLATAGMSLGQGVAMIAAGAAAQHFAPAIVIAAAGTLGTAAALGLSVTRPARN
jgi:MFS family permease